MPRGEFILQLRLLADRVDAAILAASVHSNDPSSIAGQVLAFAQTSACRADWTWDDDSVKICSDVVLFRCMTADEVHELAVAACDAVGLHNERQDRIFRLSAVRMGAACGLIESANEKHSCFPSCKTISRAEQLEKAAPPFGICADGTIVARMPNKTGGQYGPLRKISGANGERLTGHLKLFHEAADVKSAESLGSTLSPHTREEEKTLVTTPAVFQPEVVEARRVEDKNALPVQTQGKQTVVDRFVELVKANTVWDLLKLLATLLAARVVSPMPNTWWVPPAIVGCLFVLLWRIKTPKDNK